MVLAAEAVQGAALALERVDDIHGGDGLAAGVLGVGDCISDDIFQVGLSNSSCLFIYQSADTFYTTTSCKTTNCRLSNTFDIFFLDLHVSLCEYLSSFSFAYAFASFAWS